MAYTGYKELVLSEEDFNQLYTNKALSMDNPHIFKHNEYLIALDSSRQPVDYFKYVNGEFIPVKYQVISSEYLGEVKPRNPQQRIAIDLLKDKDITIKLLGGRMGSGKDYLMLSQAYAALQSGEFEKIVYIRNNIGVEGSKDIGYLPGDMIDKSLSWCMPLADILGGLEPLRAAIEQEIIEVQPLYFLRGRSFKNSIIYVSEGENLLRKNCQLIIARAGEGSQVWMNGDCRQTDADAFRKDSGMEAMVARLAGNKKFGYVRLEKSERSETAALADLLD